MAKKNTAAKAPEAKPWDKNMNPEQAAVIAHDEGPLYNAAVAGCGKTRVVVNRIARLVEDRGIAAERILAVTFSKKAAEEMNTRLEKDLDIEGARVGTWHSLANQIIREDELPQSRWKIDEKDRFRSNLKEAVGYKHLDWKRADVTKLQSFIGWCKAQLWSCDSEECANYAATVFGHEARYAISAYRIADDLTHGACLLTFDDMLVFAARHLQVEENAERWAAKWEYVIVDEAQDNSIVQIVMLDALGRGHTNVHVCGDPAQSIYGFRGSNPSHFVGFAPSWESEVVFMNRNYRSGRKIVDTANRAIAPAQTRLPVEMVAERDFDGSAKALEANDMDDEATHFVSWVRELVAGGRNYSDCTCLFRLNAQSRALEEALIGARIPYVVLGGTSFYERKEVKDLLAYLRVATGRDRDGDAVKRCINAPFRYLGRAFIDRVMDVAGNIGDGEPRDWANVVQDAAAQANIQQRQVASAEQWADLVRGIHASIERPETPDEAKPTKLLDGLVRATGYIEWLIKEEGEESVENSRAANVRELIRVAERFETVDDLLNYVEASIAAAKKQREKKGGDRVLLMSIHRSKGLEWPHVWVVGCSESILPHAKGDPEEERRLFYVACTRARDELVCSYAKNISTRTGIREFAPSRFLKDAGLLQDMTRTATPAPAAAEVMS